MFGTKTNNQSDQFPADPFKVSSEIGDAECLTIGGTKALSPNDIMFTSQHSFVTRPAKPLLPSHVLVFPKRVVGDSTLLAPEEIVDLHRTCYKVGEILKKEYGGDSISIFSNDIVDAGKPLAHTYVNVISRREEDGSRNDHFYDMTELESVCPHAALRN